MDCGGRRAPVPAASKQASRPWPSRVQSARTRAVDVAVDVNTQGHVRIDARKAQADEKWSDSAAVASQRLRPLRRSGDTLAKFGDNASSVTHSSAILKLHSLLQSQYITTLAVVGEVSAPRAQL
jgi:hypothetical protein